MKDDNPIYTQRQSAWIFAKAIGFVMGLQLVVGFVAAGFGLDIESMTVQLVTMLLMQLTFFVAVLSSGRQRLCRVKERLHSTPKLLAVSLAMWAVAFVAFMSTNIYFSMFLDSINYQFGELVFVTPVELVLGIVVTGIAAPMFEELVFRFGVLEGYKNSGTVKAVLLSGLAFASMHMNPEQTFYQFCLGVVCALAAIKSNSIIPAIIIHAANNLFAFAVMGWSQFDEALTYLFGQVWFVAIAIILFVAGIFATIYLGKLCQKFGKAKNKTPLDIVNAPIKQPNQYDSASITVLVSTLAFCLFMWAITFVASFAGLV